MPFDVKVGDTVSILESTGTWKNFNIRENSATSAFTLLTRSEADGGGGGSIYTRVMLDWSPTAEIGKRLRFFNNNSSASSYPYLYTQIQWTVANPSKSYKYTDADVKVNSEVRFTLDEANGKLAGQFGLKKTIDKEAGKLTFTADTLPTSAISGTLEIGETSTEGAAFVEGINEDVNALEQTAAIIKFPTFLINGTKVQRVYITGREIIQPGGSKQATVNLATYGIDDAKIMMTDGKMNECILASAETLSTITTYFPTVRAGTGDVSGNHTLFFNIDTEPPAEEACIINYQYICLIKLEV